MLRHRCITHPIVGGRVGSEINDSSGGVREDGWKLLEFRLQLRGNRNKARDKRCLLVLEELCEIEQIFPSNLR